MSCRCLTLAVDNFGTVNSYHLPNQHKLNSTQELCAYIDSYVASYNPSAKPFHWDYQIKRDINQRANTLSNLAFVASDFSALKNTSS